MKKNISTLLVLTLLLSLTACGLNDTPMESTPVTSTAAVSHYPVTVTDQADREVTITQEPQRLISSYYITTSLLMALDLDEKLVGIENDPELRPIYELSNPNLLGLPWVGTAKTLDLEACAALEPDLVILPLRLKDSALILEDLGIDVLLVNPESQELLTEMIQMVAKACNRENKAEALLSFLSEKEAYLRSALADADAPSVYLSGNSNFLSTAGDAMYQADMIRLAGGRNVAAELADTYWAEIDYEQLLAWNPDYIILASSAKYTIEDVLNDPNLADCSAVVNGNVFQIPADAESWDSPVPSSILGAFWLANILHPELLTDTNCTEIMDEYYETFYQFTYSKN
ncbi:MAG: ABC transporter substrate-binding protein [Oscillospiraceae bacterium]|nr:ABC transporter substrate-binding protein [Oscillospiraceae bacterium]